jgi:hypothetical protein
MTHTEESLSTAARSAQSPPTDTTRVGEQSVGRPLILEEEPTAEAQPWGIAKKLAIGWAMIGVIGMAVALFTHHWKLFPIGLFFFVGPVVMGLAVHKIREDERRRLEEIEAEAAEDGAPR